jgi:G3E family GTPase
VETLFYKTDKPLDLDRFGIVLRDMPRGVIRAKGFIHFSDRKASKNKFILQMVGARPVLDAKPWAKGEQKQSALVFIGRGFDKASLLKDLKACEMN